MMAHAKNSIIILLAGAFPDYNVIASAQCNVSHIKISLGIHGGECLQRPLLGGGSVQNYILVHPNRNAILLRSWLIACKQIEISKYINNFRYTSQKDMQRNVSIKGSVRKTFRCCSEVTLQLRAGYSAVHPRETRIVSACGLQHPDFNIRVAGAIYATARTFLKFNQGSIDEAANKTK